MFFRLFFRPKGTDPMTPNIDTILTVSFLVVKSEKQRNTPGHCFSVSQSSVFEIFDPRDCKACDGHLNKERAL
jgi:hypothetical protein